MKLKIYAIVLFFLISFNFAFGKNDLYVFYKKIDNGILLGVEALDSNYTYYWNISSANIFNKKTFSPIIKIPINRTIKNTSGTIIAKPSSGNQSAEIRKSFNFEIPEPRISIARYNKELNLILPILEKISKNDYLIAMPFDFFSKSINLTYKWIYFGKNIGQNKTLYLNSLNVNSGETIQILATDPQNSTEYAKNNLLINFE